MAPSLLLSGDVGGDLAGEDGEAEEATAAPAFWDWGRAPLARRKPAERRQQRRSALFCRRRTGRVRGEKDWQRAVDNPGGLWYFGATAKSKKAQKGTADQTGPYREAPVGERREGNRVEGPWPGGPFRRRSPRSCAVKPKRGVSVAGIPPLEGSVLLDTAERPFLRGN